MISFGPVQSSARKVIAGLAGGTGAGKSYSALELGTGLVADPATQLFLIDTEFGRASHYANDFAFQYGELGPPFRPERYIEAIDAAIDAGAKCVIIDSLSHMWEGESGLLDWHGEIALKMARGNEDRAEAYNFPAWRLPKQELQKFTLYLQRCPVHLILCMRAKPKSKMVKAVKDGRSFTEIVDAGLQPIIDTATPYEATFLAMLTHDKPGVPHWTHKALASYLQPIFDGGNKPLSREHGRRLAEWCGKSNAAAATEQPNGGKREPDLQQRQATMIAEELRAAPLAERPKIWMRHWPVIEGLRPKLQQRLEAVRDEGTPVAVPESKPAPEHGNDFDADVAHLEPDEWKREEGRVEDERQAELLP